MATNTPITWSGSAPAAMSPRPALSRSNTSSYTRVRRLGTPKSATARNGTAHQIRRIVRTWCSTFIVDHTPSCSSATSAASSSWPAALRSW